MTNNSGEPVVLIVDDDAGVLSVAGPLISRWGFQVIRSTNGREAIDLVQKLDVDVVMVDLRMPGVDGLGVLGAIRESAPDCRAILMTGYATEETKLQAVKLGALDYLPKPLDWRYLEQRFASIREDIERRQTICGVESEVARRLEFVGLTGRSPLMNDLFDLIRRLAPYARVALITGETGVGKELVAKAMHQLGPRRDKRFVAINCSAVVESLFESELFGHVRGAFTGATDHKVGLFEQANGGTIFLDEVGELPLSMQAKLLRVLELGEVYRVGSAEPRKIDVTIVAATNRDLEAEVAAGRFRSDLYYRLNIVELTVPPLRDRREDIPYLTASLLEECTQRLKKRIVGLTRSAERMLVSAEWPGNVRQLRNVIERAAILADGEFITDRELRAGLPRAARPALPVVTPLATPVVAPSLPVEVGLVSTVDAQEESLASANRTHIHRVLMSTGGNRQRAADKLGVSRRTFYRMLKRFDLGDQIRPRAVV